MEGRFCVESSSREWKRDVPLHTSHCALRREPDALTTQDMRSCLSFRFSLGLHSAPQIGHVKSFLPNSSAVTAAAPPAAAAAAATAPSPSPSKASARTPSPPTAPPSSPNTTSSIGMSSPDIALEGVANKKRLMHVVGRVGGGREGRGEEGSWALLEPTVDSVASRGTSRWRRRGLDGVRRFLI